MQDAPTTATAAPSKSSPSTDRALTGNVTRHLAGPPAAGVARPSARTSLALMAAPLDDRALVTAAQGGDRAALDQLFHRHYDRVHAVCRRITGNDADADDAAQEAMIAMVRGLARFDGRSSFGTWAYRIATNASLAELRRRRRRPVLSGRDHDSSDGPRRHEQADHRAGQRIDQIAERSIIDVALAALPEEFRVPVVLRDVADLDYAEIAAVLEIPIGTVKSRIARGRGMLAGKISLADGNHSNSSGRPTHIADSHDHDHDNLNDE